MNIGTQDVNQRPSILEERPIYFIVALWGAEFRSLFLDLLLPSLLAPGNIPALVNKTGSRFLIATTQPDWEALKNASLFTRLRAHVEVIHIDITAALATGDKFSVMTRAHKLAADRAIESKAFGVFLCPDTVISDGAVQSLQDRASAGVKVVLVAALRHKQESFLAALRASSAYDPNKPFALSPRELMRISLPHLHPQAVRRDFDSGEFAIVPGFCIWRSPDQTGIILHNTRWAPLLFSYGDLDVHHAASNYAGEGHVSVDDEYVYRNFGASNAVQAVTDSDEIAYVSLTSVRELQQEPVTSGMRSKRLCLRVSLFSGLMDPLQWKFFRSHIRLHTGDITDEWKAKEKKIDELLDKMIKSPASLADKFFYKLIILRYVVKELFMGNSRPVRAVLRLP